MLASFRRATLPAVIAVVALVVAACGSSTGTAAPGTATGSDAAGVATAQAALARYEAIPTSIVQTAPLTAKPPKKTAAFIECADANCVFLAQYMKEATDALGWNLLTINASSTDPGSAVQQAIDAGADYISSTGYPLALYQQQASEAKAKNIPIFECYSTDVPGGTANDLYSDCNDGTAATAYSAALADYITAESNGKANTLLVTIPSYPILTAQVGAAKAEFAKVCPSCGFNTLEATTDQLAGGQVPQAVVSYLQANPSINYVYFAYSGLDNGVYSALKAAGLQGQVKLVGTQGLQPQFSEVANGTASTWSALPEELSMWTMVDQMARLSVNQWSPAEERQAAVSPFYLVTTTAQAKAVEAETNGWNGPDGFQADFKKLWGV